MYGLQVRSPTRAFLILIALIAIGGLNPAQARDEWYRGLDLEGAAGSADLILVVRVSEVSETKVVFGGKAERVSQQFKFEPLQVLKGIFTRDVLSLTTDDIGNYGEGATQLERGQVRLLFLGRSGIGYANANQTGNLDRSVPPLRDGNDPLRDALQILIAVTQQHDRDKKVNLVVDGLKNAKGLPAIPLLFALRRRALLAAQSAEAAAAVTAHLDTTDTPVREAAAQTLQAILEQNYLDRPLVNERVLETLTDALRQRQGDLQARLAVLRALGQVGAPVLNRKAVAEQFQLDLPKQTLMERKVLLMVIGQHQWADRRAAVASFFEQMPVDAPTDLQEVAGHALTRLDPNGAAGQIVDRLKAKYAAGLNVQTELLLLSELPPGLAVPALLDAAKVSLNLEEKLAFAVSAYRLADPGLVATLADLLDVRRPHLRWQATEALLKINTDEAARALQPHLREEASLHRKLQLVEFLGRHGIGDGFPYAMEHLSEPELLEQAVAALVAIRDPKTVPALRQILKTSQDLKWNAAAIRGLGAVGAKEVIVQLLKIVQDLRQPLAPAALIALGDLREVKALATVQEGLLSRNDRVVIASARAAGKLVPAAEGQAEEIRTQLVTLLANADATEEVRAAVLDALLAIKDPRLNRALNAAVRDAGLEGSALLERIEKVMREQKIELKKS
ncbi:MAG: hypothetical protein JWM11_1019 [Planctomycetaceae bacterium]|nr:hypothetical protein [Planctomycetaceae bacterium]